MNNGTARTRTGSNTNPMFINVVPVVRNGLIVVDLHDGTRLVFKTPEEHKAWEIDYQKKMRNRRTRSDQ